MYNRYIPQNDGSYRRNRMPDYSNHSRPAPPPPDPCPAEPPECTPPQETCRKEPCHSQSGQGAGGFLRQLLPKDFDTGDLLIVLLLLLMAGDCPENQNTALLTLAIYLFL